MYTLIFVTVVATNMVAPMLHTQRFATRSACEAVLDASVQASMAAFNQSATGPARISGPVHAGGWTVLRTASGRTVAQIRCLAERDRTQAPARLP